MKKQDSLLFQFLIGRVKIEYSTLDIETDKKFQFLIGRVKIFSSNRIKYE